MGLYHLNEICCVSLVMNVRCTMFYAPISPCIHLQLSFVVVIKPTAPALGSAVLSDGCCKPWLA